MNRGIRLGMVGPVPPPRGGMAIQTLQLAHHLRIEGLIVDFVPVNPPYRPNWIRHVRGVRALFRLVPYLYRLWAVTGRVQILHVMANSGWSWHLFAAPAIWIGVIRGTPVLVNYRGGAAAAFLRRQSRWVLPTLRRASRIVVPSAFLQEVFRGHGVETEVIPNAVDIELFHLTSTSGTVSDDAPHLMVARNLETIYDIATAIRAFHLLRRDFPAARLTIAGSGPELNALRNLVARLGLTAAVHFSGSLGQQQMAELYRHADLLLNPSIEDNMPNSLLEAMASGVPIVSTDAGGIPLMIRHERDGLLVSRGDAEGMARAALRVLSDVSLRERLTRSALVESRRYAWPNIKGNWLLLYASLMKKDREKPVAA